MNTFLSSAGTSMPVIRTLSKVAKQALLGTPGCGCQPLTLAVRNISFSPRQVTSDASFHSVSFSETDHPKVLITGMLEFNSICANRSSSIFFFFLILHDSQCVEKSCGWEHNVLWWDSTPAGFITSLQWRQRAVSVENKRVGGERLASFLKHALLLSYFSLHGNQQWWLWAAAHFKARSLLWWLSVSLLVLQVVWVSSGWGSPNSWGKTSSSVCSLVTHA